MTRRSRDGESAAHRLVIIDGNQVTVDGVVASGRASSSGAYLSPTDPREVAVRALVLEASTRGEVVRATVVEGQERTELLVQADGVVETADVVSGDVGSVVGAPLALDDDATTVQMAVAPPTTPHAPSTSTSTSTGGVRAAASPRSPGLVWRVVSVAAVVVLVALGLWGTGALSSSEDEGQESVSRPAGTSTSSSETTSSPTAPSGATDPVRVPPRRAVAQVDSPRPGRVRIVVRSTRLPVTAVMRLVKLQSRGSAATPASAAATPAGASRTTARTIELRQQATIERFQLSPGRYRWVLQVPGAQTMRGTVVVARPPSPEPPSAQDPSDEAGSTGDTEPEAPYVPPADPPSDDDGSTSGDSGDSDDGGGSGGSGGSGGGSGGGGAPAPPDSGPPPPGPAHG